MTIRRGEEWGRVGPLPEGIVVAVDDAGLFRLLNEVAPPRAVGLVGGDLARTLGSTPGRVFETSEEVVIVTIDVGIAVHDGGHHRFAAHAVARRSWWHGPIVGVFNAQYRGRWDVAPRSHPNDGLLDILEVDASMSVRQRWEARHRLRTASHLPHPGISTRRTRTASWSFERPMVLWLDGVELGATRALSIEVEPDFLTICV